MDFGGPGLVLVAISSIFINFHDFHEFSEEFMDVRGPSSIDSEVRGYQRLQTFALEKLSLKKLLLDPR